MISITTYNQQIDKFLIDLEKELKIYKIKFLLSTKPYVKVDKNDYCNGYFDNQKKELAIAIGRPLKHWFPILIHESCHFEQWKENCKPWANYYKIGNDDILSAIISGESKYTNKEIKRFFSLTRDMELDCERRTLKKIKKYNLPVDIIKYAKQAGAYVMFYNYIAQYQKWYKIGKEPYKNKEIISLMPNNLNGNFSKLTPKLKKLYSDCV